MPAGPNTAQTILYFSQEYYNDLSFDGTIRKFDLKRYSRGN